MSKTMVEKLRELLETEEGKKSFTDFFKKYENREIIYNNQLERAFKKFGLNISTIVEKVVEKYTSDKYRDLWWNQGCEPPESLYFFLFDYAAKYGVVVDKNSPIEYKKFINTFTSEIYYLDGYIFNKIIGQGTCILVEKVAHSVYLGSKCGACGGVSNHDTDYAEGEENCVLCGEHNTQWEHLYKK